MYRYLKSWMKQLAAIGNQPTDTEKQKLLHSFLIYIALLTSSSAILWGSIYLYLGLLLPASIPFGYALLTVVNLWYFSVSNQFRVTRFIQILSTLLLPFFLQWSLGGFIPSGAVMLWAMIAMLSLLAFQEMGLTLRWFFVYLLLTVVSGVVDSNVATYAPSISSAMVTLFFIINICGVSVIVFGLINYLVRSRELAHEELELKNEALEVAQTQLIQAEKMAAIGNLTAGIAHEINTPIGAINSNEDVVVRCVAKLESIFENNETANQVTKKSDYQTVFKILRENSQISTTAIKRIVKIVSSLKNFVRLDEAEFLKVDLHEGIENTLTLIQHEIKDKIHVAKEYGKLPKIYCSPSELNQVFMTLLRNAVQAIEQEGVTTINTSADEEKVYIRISDTGKGIPSEQLKTIFDLSFTTKDSRVGMAMGLVNAYQIIQQHHGELKVESEVGKGSTFTIILPMDL